MKFLLIASSSARITKIFSHEFPNAQYIISEQELLFMSDLFQILTVLSGKSHKSNTNSANFVGTSVCENTTRFKK